MGNLKKDLEAFVKVTKIKKPNDMEYSISLDNAKFKQKFIKRIEKVVRSSLEYKDYIRFLKENMELDKCAFFQAVTSNRKNSKSKITIEIHHEPFTLYEICAVILNKFIKEGLPIDDLAIADEVLECHYNNLVGLIPLSVTIHQMYHSQESDKVIIPIYMVYGDYAKFLEAYDGYIDDDLDYLYDKLARKIDVSKKVTEETFAALAKEFEYLEVDGFDEVEKVEMEELQSA